MAGSDFHRQRRTCRGDVSRTGAWYDFDRRTGIPWWFSIGCVLWIAIVAIGIFYHFNKSNIHQAEAAQISEHRRISQEEVRRLQVEQGRRQQEQQQLQQAEHDRRKREDAERLQVEQGRARRRDELTRCIRRQNGQTFCCPSGQRAGETWREIRGPNGVTMALVPYCR